MPPQRERGSADLRRAALADPENAAVYEALVRALIREDGRLRVKDLRVGLRALKGRKGREPPAEDRIKLGAPALASLAQTLARGPDARRLTALASLSKIGPRQARPLTEVITACFREAVARDERPLLRAAGWLLVGLGDERAVPGLLGGYDELVIHDDESRELVIDALRACGDARPEVLALLARIREDAAEDEEVRAAAGAARVALAARKPEGLEAIHAALRSGISEERGAAVNALYAFQPLGAESRAALETAILQEQRGLTSESLTRLLAVADEEAALACLRNPGLDGGQRLSVLSGCIASEIPTPRLVEEILELRRRGGEELSAYELRFRVNARAGLRAALLGRLGEDLADEDLGRAFAAAVFLHEFSAEPRRFLDFVPRVLEGGCDELRVRALAILGRFRRLPKSLKPPLRLLAEHPKVAVRISAQGLLFAMPGLTKGDLGRLIKALSDRSARVKIAAAHRLALIPSQGQAAIPALKSLTKSKSPRVKDAARRALEQIEAPPK